MCDGSCMVRSVSEGRRHFNYASKSSSKSEKLLLGSCALALKMSAASPVIDGRRISDLRVADLRKELEKRGIEPKGLKADLVKQLEKVGMEEFAQSSPNQAI